MNTNTMNTNESGHPRLDRYISPSRLNLWLSCPLAFRFKYVDGLFSAPSPGLFLGKRVHDGLALYYRYRRLGITLDCAEVVRHVIESWDEAIEQEPVAFKNPGDEEPLKRQAVALIRTYLAAVPPDEAPPLAVEELWKAPAVDPLTGEDLDIPLLGIVDLVLDGPNGPVIIDFKTTARSGAPLEIVHEI